MLKVQDFTNSQQFEVKNMEEALDLCQKLRQKDLNTKYVVIVNESTFWKSLKFPFENFYIKGKEKVTLENNLYARQLNSDYRENSTWRTASFTITGNNNIFENFSFVNSALNPAKKGQEVALSVFGNNNLFINNEIISTQDSLFVGPLPDDLVVRYLDFIPEDERYKEGTCFNHFNNCLIKGSVDFIFGAGDAYFQNCTIESVEDGRMGISYVSAPAHSLKNTFGFLFYQCQFTSSTIFQQRVYLSRPWRDFGKAVFIDCHYDSHICQEGFISWDHTARYLTARFEEYPLQKGRIDWIHNQKEIPSFYLEVINEK